MKHNTPKKTAGVKAARAIHSPSPKVHPKASAGSTDGTPAKPAWIPSATAASESTLRHLVYSAGPQFAENSSGGGGGGGDDDDPVVQSISGVGEAYCLNSEITVTATVSGSFNGNVSWSGNAQFSNIQGVTATAKLTTSGTVLTISAAIGAQSPVSAGTFIVVDRECKVADSAKTMSVPKPKVTSRQVGPGAAAGSTTIDGDPDVDVDAFCDCKGSVWRCRITKATQQFVQDLSLPDYSFNALLPPADCRLLRAIEMDLRENLPNVSQTAHWTVAAQVEKHENVHLQHFKDAIRNVYSTLVSGVDTLSLPLKDYPTAAQAKSRFESMPEFKNAKKNFLKALSKATEEDKKHNPPGDFLDVNQEVLQPLLEKVLQVKQIKGCPP